MGFWSHLGIWLSGIGGGRGVMGFWSHLEILAVGYRWWGDHGIPEPPGYLAVGYRWVGGWRRKRRRRRRTR